MDVPPQGAAASPSPPAGAPARVTPSPTWLDTSASDRLPVVMEMVAGLSRAADPRQVLTEFARGLRRLDGPRGYVSLSTRGLEAGQYKITRLLVDDVESSIGSADPWREWSRLAVHRGGLLGRIIETAYPQIVHHADLRDDPVVGDRLARYRSLMAIPLFDDGEPLNWAITLREDPEGFSLGELEDAVLRSNLGGTAVKNVRIMEELRQAHAAIRHEVEQIGQIQRQLLPQTLPRIPGVELDVSFEMFDQAGGDMYALRPLRALDPQRLVGEDCCDEMGPWGVLVADVSGHGLAAAVVMAMMQSIIDTFPREPAGPAEVLDYANYHLSAKRIESRFVTAFLGIYDPRSRRLTYARAGHNPPVWMRPGAEGWDMARLDVVGGIPLGIMDDVTYEEATVQLHPGHSLVLYTDGVTEAMSPAGRMFGIEGIERSLTECTGYPQCAIDHITTTLREHEAGVRPTDDQTVVVLRISDEDCRCE